MNLLYVVFLLILRLSTVGCQNALPLPASNQVCLIVPPDVEQCYRQFQGKPIDDKSAQVNCLQRLLWNFTPDSNNTQTEMNYFRGLAGDISAYTASNILRNGNPRPPSGKRARQEYRTLTLQERQRFHAALNKLYEDGTIRAFARLHARAFRSHHNGASFLPWHRVYLVMFEEALRRVDRRVSLPFWDSTMDNDMDNPVNSVLWKPEYFGNGIGDVTSGPAAGWVTDQGNLERNYGQASRLFSKDQIRKVLSRCELQQISQPTAEAQYDFELYHGGPHVWVGGDMSSPISTGYDPIFYMHHAFVDYVWELFRRRQYRRCGNDPTQDYPNVAAGNSHAPDSPMTGFEWLTNADGLKHYWIDNWYYYESTPSCPNCCRGCPFPAPINCNRGRRVCVARSRRTFAFGPRAPNTSPAEAFAQASLDTAEIEALSLPAPPRNRGIQFQHLPSDGRTIHTAISDAFSAFNAEERSSQESSGTSRDRTGTDRRGQRRSRGGRTSERTIPEGWGPPPDRGTASGGRSSPADRRGFSERRGSSPDRGTASDGRSGPADRRGFSERRGSSSGRGTASDGRSGPADRRGFSERRGSPSGRGTASDGRSGPADRRGFAERMGSSSGRGTASDGRSGPADRRGFSERMGPQPDRGTTSDGRSGPADRRGFSERRGSSSGRRSPDVSPSQTERRQGTSGGRILSQNRRIFADPRGSSPDRRTLVDTIVSQPDRSLTDGHRGLLADRRLSPGNRGLGDTVISGRGQRSEMPVSFADTRDVRLSNTAASTSERLLASGTRAPVTGSRLMSPDGAGRLLQPTGSGISPPAGRLAPPENLVSSPELNAFSAGRKTSMLDMTAVKLSMRSPRNRGLTFDAPR